MMQRKCTRNLQRHSQPYPHLLRTFQRLSVSKERWHFWKERFEFFRNYESLGQKMRESGAEGLGRMVEIERCDSESKVNEGSSLP